MSLKLITKYHPNGQKHYEGYYDETDPIGDQVSWYDNGNKEYESIELNELNEICTYWHKNGNIKSNEIFIDNKKLSTTLFKYFKNGHLESKVTVKNAILSGESKFWYKNGRVKKIQHYKEGKLHGKFVEFYKNGKKFIQGSYSNYQPDGQWFFWNKNGLKTEERFYKNNKLLEKTLFKYSFFIFSAQK